MAKKKWEWKKGRLVRTRPGTNLSFNINEAYHRIPTDDDIAEACEGVLRRYKTWRDEIELELRRKARRLRNGR